MSKTSQKIPIASLGLRTVSLFAGLSDAAIQEAAGLCSWRRCRRKEQILSRQARDRDVYFIVSGRVRVTAFSAGGRQVTFRDMGSGEWFGELAALDAQPRSADVVAMEETVVASIPPARFRELLHRHPAACDAMLARLARSVRDLTARVFELSTVGVQNRVHAEILRLAREAGIERNAARIEPAPRHADMASQISTYREQVTRELSLLVRRGLLAREGRALVVRDVAELAKLVEDARSRL